MRSQAEAYWMKVLFCIKALTNAGGGAERVLVDLASGLVERGHEIAVLSYDRPGEEPFYRLDPRVEYVPLGLGSTVRRAGAVETVRRIIALRRTITARCPDVAVGFMHSMFIPLGLALFGMDLPVVASEHIVPAHYRTRPIEALLLLTTPLFSARMTVVSEQVRAQYPWWLRRTMVALPNPVSVTATGQADVAGAKGARKTLLAVGRLEPQKDHETLIRAFARIAGRAPDWDLRIVGEGQLRKPLEALVRDLGLSERVRLPGATRNIGIEYLNAHLFAVPSQFESFGLTTAEALAHGLPAVGFQDCPGTNLLVQNGVNGILADPAAGRTESYALALLRLMTDADLRVEYGQQAASLASLNAIDEVLDQWERLLGDTSRNA